MTIGGTTASLSKRTFTIPASTAPGPTRMRVGVSDSGPPQTCGVANDGEFEDFTVLIPPP